MAHVKPTNTSTFGEEKVPKRKSGKRIQISKKELLLKLRWNEIKRNGRKESTI